MHIVFRHVCKKSVPLKKKHPKQTNNRNTGATSLAVKQVNKGFQEELYCLQRSESVLSKRSVFYLLKCFITCFLQNTCKCRFTRFSLITTEEKNTNGVFGVCFWTGRILVLHPVIILPAVMIQPVFSPSNHT